MEKDVYHADLVKIINILMVPAGFYLQIYKICRVLVGTRESEHVLSFSPYPNTIKYKALLANCKSISFIIFLTVQVFTTYQQVLIC